MLERVERRALYSSQSLCQIPSNADLVALGLLHGTHRSQDLTLVLTADLIQTGAAGLGHVHAKVSQSLHIGDLLPPLFPDGNVILLVVREAGNIVPRVDVCESSDVNSKI